jgi:hypothetical protein
MNFCTLCRIQIFLFIEINVAMNLPSILYYLKMAKLVEMK